MSKENEKIDWEKLSFEIITMAGVAKSIAMAALKDAKNGDFQSAIEKINKANSKIDEASHKHMDVIVKEAQGVKLDYKVLFIHAEDQLLTTQTLILVIKEFVEVYKKIKEKND